MGSALARLAGPALIALAASLWATDAVFRVGALQKMDPLVVVFTEHLIALLALAPWVLLRHRGSLLALSRKDWLCAIAAGVGGSALGTLFFTASFSYLNPSVAILLQKTQPLIVVLLAVAFLGERPSRAFYLWAAVALGATLVLTFPDLRFDFLRHGLDLKSRGVLYALGAAFAWGAATVTGRALTQGVDPMVATFWRYALGLGTLGGMMALVREPLPVAELLADGARAGRALAYMALLSGLAAMIAYYQGLKRTPASVATFVELIFPVSAVAINTVVLDSPLTPVQIAAGGVLLVAVTGVSRET